MSENDFEIYDSKIGRIRLQRQVDRWALFRNGELVWHSMPTQPPCRTLRLAAYWLSRKLFRKT